VAFILIPCQNKTHIPILAEDYKCLDKSTEEALVVVESQINFTNTVDVKIKIIYYINIIYIMSVRQSVKRGHEDSETIPEKKVKDYEESECIICREDFKDIDNIRKLEECKHKFHIDCINAWLDKLPMPDKKCPTCLTNIELDNEVKYQSKRDTERVKLNPEKYDIPIFLGAVICLNGRIFKKYYNIDLDLDIDANIGDLNTAVINKLKQNTNNIFSSISKPTFKIDKIYYGTPANCDKNEGLNTEIRPAAHSNRKLIDVYKDYFEKFYRYILNIQIEIREGKYKPKKNDKKIFDIYYVHEIIMKNDINNTDITLQTDYIYNKNNPDVPADYIVQPTNYENYPETVNYDIQSKQSEKIRRKSTYTPLAWLVFQVEEVNGTPGGSLTRKKRRANKKKSRKHK
jgi:hypothetical protein